MTASGAPGARPRWGREHAIYSSYSDFSRAFYQFYQDCLTDLSRDTPQGPEALRQRIKMFVAGFHGHLQPLHIEEDDEKVVIQKRLKRCRKRDFLLQLPHL